MLAQLLLVIAVQVGFSQVPVTVLIPMKSKLACDEWKKDPAPVIPAGGRIVQMTCVDLGDREPAKDEKPA